MGVVVVSLFIGKIRKASMGEATCEEFFKERREGSISGVGTPSVNSSNTTRESLSNSEEASMA